MPLLRIRIGGQTRLLESFKRERAGEIAAAIIKAWPQLAELGTVVLTAEDGNIIEILEWKKHDSHNAA